jgi:hypothetical protein
MALRDQPESFAGRTYYKGSGVDWVRFFPWLLAAFICAAILAEGMALLYSAGYYLILIVPAVAALGVAGMLNLAVSRGHCRSQRVAGLAGLSAGIFLYLGYFYMCMVHDLGPTEGIMHTVSFPDYIRLRMMTERMHDIGAPSQGDQNKVSGVDPTFMNWGRFGFELILVLLITTGAAVRRSKKTYCETCHRWMTRELTQFDPAQSTELMEALRVQSARSLAALSAGAPFATVPNLTAAVDYCSSLKEGRALGCPAYLSIKSIVAGPKGAALDPFDQSKGKLLVRAMQLNGDEISALTSRFNIFQTITGRITVNVPLASPAQRGSIDDKSTYADISPVPTEYAGKVLTRKNVIVASLFAFSVMIGFLGGLLLTLLGSSTAFPDHPPVEGVSPGAKQLGIAFIVLGGACVCVSVAIVFLDLSFFGNRYLRNVLRRELGRRTSVLVDPNDPDALFVECVPKLNWGKLMLDNAGDAGLMVVDRQKQEIRFEGDKERWRIPAASIQYCELEVFIQQQGHYRNKMYYVVLRVNHRAGFWEAPIRPRGKLGLFSGKRKKAAEELFELIQSVRERKPVQDMRVTG